MTIFGFWGMNQNHKLQKVRVNTKLSTYVWTERAAPSAFDITKFGSVTFFEYEKIKQKRTTLKWERR